MTTATEQPHVCPLCQSTDTDHGSIAVETTEFAMQRFICTDCATEWNAMYKFSGNEVINWGDAPDQDH